MLGCLHFFQLTLSQITQISLKIFLFDSKPFPPTYFTMAHAFLLDQLDYSGAKQTLCSDHSLCYRIILKNIFSITLKRVTKILKGAQCQCLKTLNKYQYTTHCLKYTVILIFGQTAQHQFEAISIIPTRDIVVAVIAVAFL